MSISWLPKLADWNERFRQARGNQAQIAALKELANADIDFMQTLRLDGALQALPAQARASLKRTPPVRLAVLGSCTVSHLLPAIRIGGLRRGISIEIYEAPYGSYLQQLADTDSDLYRFRPDFVLLALDAHHITALAGSDTEECMKLLRSCRQQICTKLRATPILQTILPVFPSLMGSQEHLHSSSPACKIAEINQRLRQETAAEHVPLLAVDALVANDGLAAWFDAALWYRAKQEISPIKAPEYGDEVARLLAALRGLSSKCLVLDLDNTLWGGVIGDDGLEGIVLGQNSAAGEAFVAFQRYVKRLAQRGVILAVCSKNDEANAKLPFERHPEMVLRLDDIACFIADWQDKVGNLQQIADSLNIGIDSLVFVDDNPFERNLVRRELPMVAVPELPEDPALYKFTLARAGYFESLQVTGEDLERNRQYRANLERETRRAGAIDLDSYLAGLAMEIVWAPFDEVGLPRIAQLVNKSNQFNLTTRRYSEQQLRDAANDRNCLTLQLRLTDRYGDNGMIAVLLGRTRKKDILYLDTWLMSCRVLGRGVEEACLNLLAAEAQRRGIATLLGEYLPSEKNGMVREHYARLDFTQLSTAEDGSSLWQLNLANFVPRNVPIELIEEARFDLQRDLQPA